MPQMTWAGAGEPAPGAGTVAGYGFFNTVLNYMFAQHNATDTIVSAATAAASATFLPIRDAASGFAVGYLSATPVDGVGVNALYYGKLPATEHPNFLLFQNHAGSSNLFQVDYLGDVVAAGTITATGGFLGSLTGNVTGNASGTAASLAAPVALTGLISDYKPTTNVSAAQITIAAGGAFSDSSGFGIGPLGSQVAPLANSVSGSQPTGTNIQYVAISLAPGTGAPVATGGVVGASPAWPAFPTANKPVAMVGWKGATTNPSGIIAAADIVDLRNLGAGGGAAGGSGTDSGVRAAQLWIEGTNGIFGSALDSTSATSGGHMHPANIRDASTATGLDAMLNSQILNVFGNVSLGAGGTALNLNANNGPNSVFLNKQQRQNPQGTTLVPVAVGGGSAVASGGAAMWKLVADGSAAGPSFQTTLMLDSASINSNQVTLARCLWDGTTFQTQDIDYPFVQPVTGSKYAPLAFDQNVTTPGAMASTSFVVIPGSSTSSLPFAKAMRGWVDAEIQLTMGATPMQSIQFTLQVDGAGYGLTKEFGATATDFVANGVYYLPLRWRVNPALNPGQMHTFALLYAVFGTGTVSGANFRLTGEFYGQ